MHKCLETIPFSHEIYFIKIFEYKYFTHKFNIYFKDNALKISGKIGYTVVAAH